MVTATATNTRTPAEVYASLNTNSNYAEQASGKATEQQTRFLKLLTAQLKNQDPTAPLDNAQMTSQLAQISTVDGVERLNLTLQKLVNGSQTSQSVQAAVLLGKGVLVPGATTTLASGQALGGFDLASGAEKVTIEVRDANGVLMKTMNLGAQTAGIHGFAWDGVTDAGTKAVDGKYSYNITAKSGSNGVTATALARTRPAAIRASAVAWPTAARRGRAGSTPPGNRVNA